MLPARRLADHGMMRDAYQKTTVRFGKRRSGLSRLGSVRRGSAVGSGHVFLREARNAMLSPVSRRAAVIKGIVGVIFGCCMLLVSACSKSSPVHPPSYLNEGDAFVLDASRCLSHPTREPLHFYGHLGSEIDDEFGSRAMIQDGPGPDPVWWFGYSPQDFNPSLGVGPSDLYVRFPGGCYMHYYEGA
jgi:hypothetical protein